MLFSLFPPSLTVANKPRILQPAGTNSALSLSAALATDVNVATRRGLTFPASPQPHFEGRGEGGTAWNLIKQLEGQTNKVEEGAGKL